MVFSIMLFLIFLGWMLGEITGSAYALMTPTTWLIITAEMVAVIALANTPIAKGASIAVLFGTLVVTFFVDLYFNQMPVLWGILFVPLYLMLGFICLEAGK